MMSNKTTNDVSAYALPLNDEQAAILGKVTIAWGQIDFLVSYCIARLLEVNPIAAANLMDKMTSGPRNSLLNRLAVRAKNESLRKKIKQFCKAMNGLIEQRNDVFHGYWVIYMNDETAAQSVGATSSKQPGKLFTIDDLTILLKKLHAQSYVIDSIFSDLHGLSIADQSPAGYLFEEDGSIRGLKSAPKSGTHPFRK